ASVLVGEGSGRTRETGAEGHCRAVAFSGGEGDGIGMDRVGLAEVERAAADGIAERLADGDGVGGDRVVGCERENAAGAWLIGGADADVDGSDVGGEVREARKVEEGLVRAAGVDGVVVDLDVAGAGDGKRAGAADVEGSGNVIDAARAADRNRIATARAR